MNKRLDFRFAVAAITGGVLWHLAGTPAAAQYQYQPPGVPAAVAPAYPPGYPPGYGAYPYPGGYWQGQAAMLDAYGNVGKDQEQARILREQANQAKLDTQVKTIDVMAYERANKYWYSDEKADINAKKVEAAMNNPPLAEITSGRTLNVLLPWLDTQMALGTHGPDIPVDPELVKQLNITTGDTGGNAGLLRDINNLPWPVATMGANQKKLDEMLKQSTYEASSKGPISLLTASQLNKQIDLVGQDVSKLLQKNEVDSGDYILAKRFLDQTRDAVKALKQPDISKVLAGQGGPRGNTVEQVVYSMTSKGLTFAAAEPGHENAYIALYRAFVNFGLTAGTADTGFRVRVGGLPNTVAKK